MLKNIDWFTAAVLWIIVWWTVLFAVLPIGIRPVADADPATGWRGAPERPRMGRNGDHHGDLGDLPGGAGEWMDQFSNRLAGNA